METKTRTQAWVEAGQARNIARAVETNKGFQAGRPRQGDTCVLSEVNTLAARKSARFIFAYALANCLELHSKTQSLHVLYICALAKLQHTAFYVSILFLFQKSVNSYQFSGHLKGLGHIPGSSSCTTWQHLQPTTVIVHK